MAAVGQWRIGIVFILLVLTAVISVESVNQPGNHSEDNVVVGVSMTKCKFLYSAVPSHRNTQSALRFTLYALRFTSLTDLFTQTPSRLIWEARMLRIHISTFVYSQVVIYIFERTGTT